MYLKNYKYDNLTKLIILFPQVGRRFKAVLFGTQISPAENENARSLFLYLGENRNVKRNEKRGVFDAVLTRWL